MISLFTKLWQHVKYAEILDFEENIQISKNINLLKYGWWFSFQVLIGDSWWARFRLHDGEEEDSDLEDHRWKKQTGNHGDGGYGEDGEYAGDAVMVVIVVTLVIGEHGDDDGGNGGHGGECWILSGRTEIEITEERNDGDQMKDLHIETIDKLNHNPDDNWYPNTFLTMIDFNPSWLLLCLLMIHL